MVIHSLGGFVRGIITGTLFMDDHGFIHGHHWGIIMCFMGAHQEIGRTPIR